MAAGDRSKNFNPAVTAMTMLAGIGCGGAGTIRRIRQPNPQDVLSGRGGGINSHPGNKAFRQWISERKEKVCAIFHYFLNDNEDGLKDGVDALL